MFFNKRSGAVVMSPDSEGLDAAVVAGVGSSLTQSSGISYFSLYIYKQYNFHTRDENMCTGAICKLSGLIEHETVSIF